ncbi:MAG: tetratricopeptide repeat protein [Elusimicrobia bacterium]|nr:tetratricopeptide repeat protein [Elusimicrobiota bacterium]
MRIVCAALLALALSLPAGAALSAAQIHIQAGVRHFDRGEFGLAIEQFGRSMRARGGSAAYFLLGYSHFMRGFAGGSPENADRQDSTEAIAAFSLAVALDPELKAVTEPYRLYLSLALCHEALGASEKAIAAYSKAFELAPRNPLIPLYAARLRFSRNETDKSIANLNRALETARRNGKERELIDFISRHPMFSLMRRSRPHQELLRPSEQESETMVVQAESRADMFGLRDSVRSEASVVAEFPKRDKAVLDKLGEANVAFRSQRYADALEAYSKALVLNEASGVLGPGQVAFIHERMGTASYRLGLSQDAVSWLRRSVHSLPFNPSAYYQLALAYSVQGRFHEAMKALREALSTAPSVPELRKYMMLARTDGELEPLRDLPGFQSMLSEFRQRAGIGR